MDYDDSSTAPSLKAKVRSSACFSCCFRSSAADSDDPPPSILRSSSTWLKSKTHDLPEIRDRCKTLISRLGKGGRQHRRGQSAEFGYDPLSYALNFDDGNDAEEDGQAADGEEFRHRNFSARLPASPPNAVAVACG